MKRRALLALLLLAACTRRIDTAASTHAEVTRQVDTAADVVTETRTEQAPGRVTTTVEEYAPPVGPATADHEAAGVALPADRSVTPPPVLLRRTVRVEERGAIVRETAQKARRDTETHEAAKVDAATEKHERTRAGPSPWLWLGIGAGLVLLLAAAWHFREPLFKLIRRLCGVPL